MVSAIDLTRALFVARATNTSPMVYCVSVVSVLRLAWKWLDGGHASKCVRRNHAPRRAAYEPCVQINNRSIGERVAYRSAGGRLRRSFDVSVHMEAEGSAARIPTARMRRPKPTVICAGFAIEPLQRGCVCNREAANNPLRRIVLYARSQASRRDGLPEVNSVDFQVNYIARFGVDRSADIVPIARCNVDRA